MKLNRITLAVAVLVGATATGCASSNEQSRQGIPSMYSNKMDAELSTERQEFITEKQEDLEEIKTEIARLETRLQHEAQYVDADQKAEWSQDLFELKRDQADARARLEHAQNASPEEWDEMRGFFGKTIDRLEAGVSTLGGQIEQITGAEGQVEGERQPVRGDTENPQTQEQPTQEQPTQEPQVEENLYEE